MSKALRAQVSLIFSDEDLFDNLITPLRVNKELSGTIVKLLTAYYNSEEVRNLVEGVSFEDLEGADQVIDSTEAMNQIRQTLAMQDFLFEQAKQTLEDGASEMDALMKANDIAKQSGVVKTESTDVGEAFVKFSLESSTLESQNQEDNKTNDSSNLESRVGKIEEMLNNLMSMLQNGSVTSSIIPTQETVSTPEVQDAQEIPISVPTEQVLSEETKEEEILEPKVEITEPQVEVQKPVYREVAPPTPEPVVTVEDDSNSNTLEEDASSELNDILKDLLG